MIHQKDLRLGDLVQITEDLLEYKQGDTFVVIDISEDYIGLRSPDKSDGRPDMYTIGDHIEGVPLTPEILEKNGWEQEYYAPIIYGHIGHGIEISFLQTLKRCPVVFNDVPLCEIQYVHQLQHILWALGEDANLKI